ncbi:relaxase/mobilization nuclease domain-containing protein [Streptomyces aidingensis]|uniref:MobA/VirD2-like nuclease domain-containing protein n=1 Tax=Streptomyces aidingensis TaxID=910347 RepID=A0A1I1URK1_9ACTN|nr:mobilization protein [Streptomyces aidingensis]SFD70610.1 hypothetical protein SAMN05421773_12473 [Streptomyces aidingensis]
MIPKITTGKGGTRRLIAYLYGPGKHNEHTDQHMIASWNGFAPDPRAGSHHTIAELARQLDQPLALRGDPAPATTVWHCSLRAAPQDRTLTDEEWADIARRVVAATGIAPEGDLEACRWVAIRHADDHIHIAATLVRQDGRIARRTYDYKQAQAACRQIETDYGLRRLNPGDGTAAKRPTSKEHFKAHRQGQTRTSREVLRTRVRQAVTAAASEAEFFAVLDRMGVIVTIRVAPSGDLLGYTVALPGDVNAKGQPVTFAGSTLAPDLSLPRIRERLAATDTTAPAAAAAAAAAAKRRRPNPWHQATAATDRIPHLLTHDGDDAAAQAHLAALGEALDALPALTPPTIATELQHAATAFERATRSRIRAQHHQARALRTAVKTILRTPAPADDSALAMFLDAALLAVIAARHWHHIRHHRQQEAAARQALTHLHTAYTHTAAAPLSALAQHQQPQDATRRYTHHLRQTLPEYAEQILTDPAWPALQAALALAENTGHTPGELLNRIVRLRSLDDVRSPAHVLIWRIQRLADRPAPSARALAAQARSIHNRSSTTPATALAQPAPQSPPGARRPAR